MPAVPELDRRRSRLGHALVAALAAAVYANALPNDFVWDDVIQIRDNAFLRDVRNLPRAFGTSYWGAAGSPELAGHYRPLATASFVLSRAVSPSPASFRSVNVAAHAANAVLVALVAAELGLAAPAALLAGALFGVHPVTTEAVAWVVGRAEVLATSFALLAILVTLTGGRRPGRGRAAAAGAILLVGLLFKESAAAAVPIVAALELARTPGDLAARLRRAAAGALPLGAAVVGALLLRRLALGPAAYEDRIFFAGVPGWAVALTMSRVVLKYLALLAAPVTLRAHYDLVDFPVPRTPLEVAALASALAVAALAGGIGWALLRRRPWAGEAAWVLLALLPYLHIAPFQWLMAERFLYLSVAGFAILVARVAHAAWERGASGWRAGPRAAVGAAALVVLAALAARTVRRNLDWRTNVTFFAKMVEQEPTLIGARVALGAALLQEGRTAEGLEQQAIARRLIEAYRGPR